MRRVLVPLACMLLAPAALTVAQPGTTPASPKPFNETVVTDFDSPWAMTFLPDGRMLVTERDGRVLLLPASGASRQTIATIAVDNAGQGGLHDVVLHPNFAKRPVVFLTAAVAGTGGKGLVLMRGDFVEDASGARLQNIRRIYTATPFTNGDGHYAGRIAFSPDGYLFLTLGERQQETPAQAKDQSLGKVLRLFPSGKIPDDNPLTAMGFRPEIWSYGHRNQYGLAFDRDGNLWEHEMGPLGGDEVNLILPGRNYGWPNASNGSNYDGSNIPDHAPGDGYEPPKVWWNPSVSPAGLTIYKGNLFRQWRGDLLLGGLSGQSLIRVDLNGTSAAKAERFDMGARIREVETAPDGSIYLLRDGGSGGQMIRLTPK